MSKNKNKQPVRDRFFWEIPGDVPGKYSRSTQKNTSVVDKKVLERDNDNDEQLNEILPVVVNNQSRPRVFNFFTVAASLLVFYVLMGTDALNFYSDQNSNDVVAAVNTPTEKVTSAFIKNEISNNVINTSRLTEKLNSVDKKQSRTIIHTVTKGDTLWDIAESYMQDPFKYRQLVKLNKIKNPDLIFPDQKVHIQL